MDAIKRWAVIKDNKIVNVIIADEQFILDQGLNAVEDNVATVGLDVDEDGKIIYPVVIEKVDPLPEPTEEPTPIEKVDPLPEPTEEPTPIE